MNNYDYPLGSDTQSAPWNEEPLEPVEIEVDVEVTLKKRVKISVNDYQQQELVDGDRTELINDFSSCDVETAVKDQIILPDKAFDYIATNTLRGKRAHEDLSGWGLENIETELVD